MKFNIGDVYCPCTQCAYTLLFSGQKNNCSMMTKANFGGTTNDIYTRRDRGWRSKRLRLTQLGSRLRLGVGGEQKSFPLLVARRGPLARGCVYRIRGGVYHRIRGGGQREVVVLRCQRAALLLSVKARMWPMRHTIFVGFTSNN